MNPKSIIAALFPPTCMLCGAPGALGRDLCDGCAAELPNNHHCCARCALPFEAPMPDGALCGPCQRHPPPFDRCIAALRYENPVPTLVGAAKFRGRLNAARLLGELLTERVRSEVDSWPQILIPVPLHPRRLGERGYNQALEIARVPARELALPIDTGNCERIASTAPQAGLDERERRRNIRGAFAVSGPFAWDHVAIVDDVVTTGSTVAELARVLRRAGAVRVEVWAAARTP